MAQWHDEAQESRTAAYVCFCSCNTPAVMELLGDEGVNEKNLMQYLGIIEQRTNEILQVLQQPLLPAVHVGVGVLGGMCYDLNASVQILSSIKGATI